MSDLDFEELLDGVLREDARVEPLEGMSERVMARIAVEPGRTLWRWMPWAAVVTCGFAAGMLIWVRPNLESRGRGVSQPVVFLRAAPAGVAGRDLPKLREAAGSFVGNRRSAKNSPALLRRHSLEIEPIEITPLAIEPLEVASLDGKTEMKEGEVR